MYGVQPKRILLSRLYSWTKSEFMIWNHFTAAFSGLIVSEVNFNFPVLFTIMDFVFCMSAVLLFLHHQDTVSYKNLVSRTLCPTRCLKICNTVFVFQSLKSCFVFLKLFHLTPIFQLYCWLPTFQKSDFWGGWVGEWRSWMSFCCCDTQSACDLRLAGLFSFLSSGVNTVNPSQSEQAASCLVPPTILVFFLFSFMSMYSHMHAVCE